MNITQLANKIEYLTDWNDHTGANMELAAFIGGKFPAIMQSIKSIHDIEACMPYELGRYRYQVNNEMIKVLETLHGTKAAELIESKF